MQKQEVISHMSLPEAVKLLSAAEKEGIEHVVCLIRDPRKPSRILGLNVIEADPTAS